MEAVVLNCLTQFNIVWRVGTFQFLPMSKCRLRNTLRYGSGIFVFKKTFPQQTLDALPTNAARCPKASNRSSHRRVFYRATNKYVGMALNLNLLIVSAPPCIIN
jgi:hypothetical protein